MSISPLAPDSFPDMPLISGLSLATAASGMKYHGRDDMLLMCTKAGSHFAGVFTQSDTAAAPVQWNQKRLAEGICQTEPGAILTNAGNANAFTGKKGHFATMATARALAEAGKISADAILLASTGVIGEPLDTDCLAAQIPHLLAHDAASWHDAAKAIMTTDTFAKGATTTCQIDGKLVTICGIAKGSGMIAPNMATMLGYIATDAAVSAEMLQIILSRTNAKSFNAITVDSDTSTNDSVFAIATGVAGNDAITNDEHAGFASLHDAIQTVMIDLAKQIVCDGEGAQKLITIDVLGADNESDAFKIGMSIANSPLVKTAIAGSDANWGRIVMAVGKAGIGIDQNAIGVQIGGYDVARDGQRVENFDETPVAAHMQGHNIDIAVSVGTGSSTARVYTCDLTHGYITINADYRS
ncbi:bifunctional glutamate N-acetyltransferase/amino-acid acetyltransferase ArgJ [Alphaproteobacteria bacterium]|nr:bifunctional glutamate N-acetyltransferase/amino-acid acetyltransferase ArgJ [Alphaproteobacteria bacterium]